MNTILNIETRRGANSTTVFCTFQKGGARQVAVLNWSPGELAAHQAGHHVEPMSALAWHEHPEQPNRPDDRYDDAESGSDCTAELDIQTPGVAPSAARGAMDDAVLKAVALHLNPGCSELIESVQLRNDIAASGRANGAAMKEATAEVKEGVSAKGLAFNAETLASLGSHRYVPGMSV